MILLFFQRLLRRYKVHRYIQKNFPGTVIEENVQIKGDLKNLRLGKNVTIQSGTVIHLGGMNWCRKTGSLEIGDNSVISPHCVLYACGPGGIKIGKNFDCGPGVGIFASRTDYRRGIQNHVFERVTIEDNVIVYARAVISTGVTLGQGSIIAAGAVVTQPVQSFSMVGGVPAKVIYDDIRPQKPSLEVEKTLRQLYS